MSTLNIPVDVQVSEISSILNSVILLVFLMGIYTAIYFGTIYVYFARKPFKYHTVPAAVTLLYFSTITFTAMEWYATKLGFVDNGDTRQSVFLALFDNPQWMTIVVNTSVSMAYVIADGLLIWRCFYAWNRSWRIISVSLFLIITEAALFLVEISLSAKYTTVIASQISADILDDVYAAGLFISFGTTLVTTILIAYRIYSVSNQQGASSRRFKQIIDIVVQSGAVYALSQLTWAVSDVVPGTTVITNTRVFAFTNYTQSFNVAISGILPTVMVARVALLAEDATFPSSAIHFSALQFQGGSTHSTADMEVIEINRPKIGDVESKAQ